VGRGLGKAGEKVWRKGWAGVEGVKSDKKRVGRGKKKRLG